MRGKKTEKLTGGGLGMGALTPSHNAGVRGCKSPEAIFFKNILNTKILLLGHITLVGLIHNVRSHCRTNMC